VNPPTHTDIWVCVDCYFAHHYGRHFHDREPTDDELHAWHGGYLRGHDLPNMVHDENADNDDGLMVREWFAGGSPMTEGPATVSRSPSSTGLELADDTCSNHNGDDETECSYCSREGYEDGITDFTWRSCHGCGSNLGGSRYRLAGWQRKEEPCQTPPSK
jgi:hypothetical protein